jgi:prefoldin beta subunit
MIMDMDSQLQEKIEVLRGLEMQLENLLMQRQTVQIELNESLNALEEVKKTKDDVFKILSGVMIKLDKEKAIKELEEKKKIAEMKVNSFEKQEKLLSEKAEKLRKEITSSVDKNEKN